MGDEKPKPSTSFKKGGGSTSEDKSNAKDREDRESSSSSDDGTIDSIRQFFIEKLNLTAALDKEDGPTVKVIDDLSLDGVIKHWKDKSFKNIITMVGAGISTSAGIPDFRSPGSGIYDNLQKYRLPYPAAIFEMDYFRKNPQPFFALAKELYPGTFNPTLSHYFVRMLHDRGLLLRHYTQNIDTLERISGIPEDKLVEAHGSFFTNHCLLCREVYTMEWMKEQIFGDHVPTCEKCNGVVKPDIVFFGENLPEIFYKLPSEDFAKCDLLIIMGTSLEVQPFASLVNRPGAQCVRLLINRKKVGHDSDSFSSFFSGPGMLFDSHRNTRDVAYVGDCDDGVMALAEGLGWGKELRELVRKEHARLSKENEEFNKTEKDMKNDAKKSDEKDAIAASSSTKKGGSASDKKDSASKS